MRWNEIVTEGSDYHCPECNEYLGKASEVIANKNEYCGNCGWSAKPRKPVRREGMDEAMGDPMIFGHTVPNWDHEDEQDDAAMFVGDPMYQPAQVIYKDGHWQVWFHTEDQHYCKTPQEAEAVLKKYGYTTFEGYDSFSPQRPAGMED